MKIAVGKILHGAIILWGLVSLTALIIGGLWFFSRGDPDLKEGGPGKTDSMTPADVRFIMKIAPLDEALLEKVIHSFVSARAFTGDHRDAVALKATNLPIATFRNEDFRTGQWVRGDRADNLIKSALSTGRIKDWQPETTDILTANYYIHPLNLSMHNGAITAAELIYVNLETQLIYYISFKF